MRKTLRGLATATAAAVLAVTLGAPAYAQTSGGTGSDTTTVTTTRVAPACTAANVRGTRTTVAATTGAMFMDIQFTNIGRSTCTMYGYAGVSAWHVGPGYQVGPAAGRDELMTPKVIILRPSAVTHAWVKIATAMDYPGCKIEHVRFLRLFMPNDPRAHVRGVQHYLVIQVVSWSQQGIPVCANMTVLSVLPLRAGPGSRFVDAN